MAYQRIPSITNLVKTASISGLDTYRYQFLQLSNAEPNFGLPPLTAESGFYPLLSDEFGNRSFGRNINLFMLISAADSKFYPVSGGFIQGDTVMLQSLSVIGDITVFGGLTSVKDKILLVNVVSSYPGNFEVSGFLSAGNIVHDRATLTDSRDWASVYLVFQGNSAKYESTYAVTFSNSAKYESVYSNTFNNSSSWSSVYNTFKANSGIFQNAVSTLSSNSARYDSTYSNLQSNSSKWESTYTTVYDLSSIWDDFPDLSVSARWESTYNTTSAFSARWNGVYGLKNTDFEANSYGFYSVDTSGGVVRATLPLNPSGGDPITFTDPFYSWDTNNLVIQNNGNNIEGINESLSANIAGYNFKLVFFGSSIGWRVL